VVAFRREKFLPYGGPAGGDGGRGGSVYLEADPSLATLFDFQRQPVYRAKSGENGQGKDCYGAGGDDLTLRVPLGTLVSDATTGKPLAELLTAGTRVCVARGGRGGRGNIHFATPSDRAPRRAELGTAGQARDLLLELKVLADVGLLGFPNVGKSTFVRAVSRARPKVAAYPFTTLEPHLGVVDRDGLPPFVVADIPGLVEGASTGVGLGLRFLRHVERTRLLLHLVTLSYEPGRNPLHDYQVVRRELEAFKPELAQRPEIVVLSQADLPEVRDAYPELKEAFAQHGVELHIVSAASHWQLPELLTLISRTLPPREAVPAALAKPTLLDDSSDPALSAEAGSTEALADDAVYDETLPDNTLPVDEAAGSIASDSSSSDSSSSENIAPTS
jgi:GTPase